MSGSGDALRLRRADLTAAAETGILDPTTAERLWSFLAERAQPAGPVKRFDLTHVLWYVGALIVIAAMGLLQTTAWAAFGGAGLTAIALLYALGFTLAGRRAWSAGLVVPGGLLVTIAVTMAPLAAYGIQEQLGWWPVDGEPGPYRDFYYWIRGSWLPMELATIAAGVLALRYFPFGFLVMPVAVALWFMSMDLVPWIFGPEWDSWRQRAIVSLWFGLAMTAVAWAVDRRGRRQHTGESLAFWLHLFAAIAIWGGVSWLYGLEDLRHVVFLGANVLLILFAVYIRQRVYAVFGGLGLFHYLSWLAWSVFADSLAFPFVLTALGVGVMYAGILLLRHQAAVERSLAERLPAPLLRLRPPDTS